MAQPVTAQVAQRVRPDVPERPEGIVYCYCVGETWMSPVAWKNEDLSDQPHDTIRIPGEREAVYLETRTPLVERMQRFVFRLVTLESTNPVPANYHMEFRACIEGLRQVTKQIDTLDTEWSKEKGATDG